MNEQWLCCGGERGGFDIPVDRCLFWAAHLMMATPPSEGYWTPPLPLVSSHDADIQSYSSGAGWTGCLVSSAWLGFRPCHAPTQRYINDLPAPWSSSKKKHLFVGVLFLYSSGAVEVEVEGMGWIGGSGSQAVGFEGEMVPRGLVGREAWLLARVGVWIRR